MVNAPAHSVGSGSRAKSKPGIPHGEDTGFPLRIRMVQKVRLPAVSRSFAGNAAHIYALVPVSLRSSPGNGGYAWRPPYSGVRSISVTFHRNRRPSNRNRLLESMCGLLGFIPSVSVCADTGRSVLRQGQERLPRCRGKEGWVHHPQS